MKENVITNGKCYICKSDTMNSFPVWWTIDKKTGGDGTTRHYRSTLHGPQYASVCDLCGKKNRIQKLVKGIILLVTSILTFASLGLLPNVTKKGSGEGILQAVIIGVGLGLIGITGEALSVLFSNNTKAAHKKAKKIVKNQNLGIDATYHTKKPF